MSILKQFIAIILFADSAFAQFDTAAVLGTVRDPSGAVIAGARITLRNLNTGVTATGKTDAAGSYEFLTVKIGDYRVEADAPGFRPVTTDAFHVAVNARQRVDLKLEVGTATESVTVTGAATLVESDTSEKGQVVNGELIENLPLNGRNASDLALLSAGVQPSLLSSAGDPREGSFNVNGLPSSQNNFVLDGVDNNAYGTSNQGFSNQVMQASPDALQEFKVQTNNYSAEYGRAGGAVINASMRSGTNQLHGSLYEYVRNTALNATGFFKPAGGVKPVLIQNQFGGTVGGPIRRDKLFFFADYEGYRRISKTLMFATLPTVAQREGNIGIPLLNPLTGEMFSNGVIPQAQISAFAKKVMGDLPGPNNPGANNFQTLPRRRDANDKADVKIDDNVNTRLTVFARLSQRKQNDLVPGNIPGASGGAANGHVRVLNQQLTAAATYTPSVSQLVEARLGISRTKAGKTPIDFGAPGMLAGYGIPGIPEDPAVTGGLNTQSISGYTALGRQNSNPQHQDPLVFNPRVNYSKILTRHSLKIGYEHQAINTDIEDFHPKYGQDTYNGQFSRPAGRGSNNLYNLADFLFGARAQYSITNSTVILYRQRMHFAYVQDDWKVTPHLTLNAGLRYEFSTPQYEADDRLVNYDPATNSLVHAKPGSIFDRSTIHPDFNNFAPRIGIAYSIDKNTVLRSSYGISYIQFNRMGGENLLSYNGPTIVTVTINQTPSQGICTAGQDPTKCFRPMQQGYPENLATPANFDPKTARVNFIPADYRTPYVQSWHFTVQRELAHNLLLDVAYVGTHGTKLMVLGDWNEARPSRAGENLTVDQRRPIPGFSYIEIAYNGNSSVYNALQAKLQKRYARRLFLLNSFTWSKSIDYASGHLEANNGDNSRVNLLNVRNERGLSGYDRRFNNTTTITYELPKGHGWASAIYGNWRTSVINTMYSGQPVNLTWSPAANGQLSTVLNYRPNTIGNPNTPQGDPNNYLSRTNVINPDITHPYGTAGRNTATAPATFQTDVRVQKNFPLKWEKSRLEFQAECFNLLNKTNFRAPNANRSNSNFGTITSTFAPRIMQFALRFAF
jgi:Carboxypeptidase regulatory-like domain/TonB dependent receptor/TonB-dependent Receptor Plug Domain